MGLFDAILGNVNTKPIQKAYTQAGAAYPQAAAQQVAGLQAGQGTLNAAEQAALQAQKKAAGQETGYLNQALGLYGPLAGITGGAEQMYANALGLGGAGGTQAALGAFQQGPGYQYQLAQGLDALQREANSRGMLGSGNLTQDELAYSQNLANQGWQNWLGQLGGLGAQNLGVVGAQSGLYGGLADIAGQQGQNVANIYSQFAPQIAASQAGVGQAQAGGTLGQAQNRLAGASNIFNVQQQAGANALDFWGNLLGGITSGAGRYFGQSGGATPTAGTFPSWQTTVGP